MNHLGYQNFVGHNHFGHNLNINFLRHNQFNNDHNYLTRDQILIIAVQLITAAMGTAATANTETAIIIIIVNLLVVSLSQQPIRARIGDFDDKDRRIIDPPPVVRLVVTNTDDNTVPERIDINHPSELRVQAGACNYKTVELGPFGECAGIVDVLITGKHSSILSSFNSPAWTTIIE
nr:10142_t:CDS:2 [Entrophospora candida]